jgi:hypothetical protein
MRPSPLHPRVSTLAIEDVEGRCQHLLVSVEYPAPGETVLWERKRAGGADAHDDGTAKGGAR